MTLLRKLQSYVDLPPVEVAQVKAALGNPTKVDAHQAMLTDGESRSQLLVMISGWAMRYKSLQSGARQILAFLIPGDTFDIRNMPPGAIDIGIEALSKCEVVRLSGSEYDALRRACPGFAKAMLKARNAAEATLGEWLVGIGRRSGIQRTGHLILELYSRARVVGLVDNDGWMSFPLSQLALADAVGLTPVHLNRVLQSLRGTGALYLRGRRLRIIDEESLRLLSGFDEGYLGSRFRKAIVYNAPKGAAAVGAPA